MYLPTSKEQLADILRDLELYCRLEPLPEVLEHVSDARLLLQIAQQRLGTGADQIPSGGTTGS